LFDNPWVILAQAGIQETFRNRGNAKGEAPSLGSGFRRKDEGGQMVRLDLSAAGGILA
jgi:hypothetical protein